MFNTRIRVNFFDADPAGIMYYGNIFRIAHSAFEDFMDSAGFQRNYFTDPHCVLPVLHTEADYKKPLLPNTFVNVNLRISQLRSSSFEITYSFSYGEVIVASVRTVHVCIDKAEWKKIPLPEELRDYLARHQPEVREQELKTSI